MTAPTPAPSEMGDGDCKFGVSARRVFRDSARCFPWPFIHGVLKQKTKERGPMETSQGELSFTGARRLISRRFCPSPFLAVQNGAKQSGSNILTTNGYRVHTLVE